MAIYNIPNYKTANGFGMPLNMRRANPDPLDNSSVWGSYAEALNYAQNDPVAYVGQIVTVVTAPEEGSEAKEHTVEVYKIELDSEGKGTLVKVGTSDEVADLDTEVKQIETDLADVKTDVEEVSGKVDTIETDLGTAKNDIDKAEESIAANTEAIGKIETDVEQLKKDVDAVEELAANNKTRLDQYDTDKANYATKDEVATSKSEAIAAAKTETENQISAVVSQYLTGEGAADTIDTLQEIVDWVADDESGAAKLVADVKAIKDDYLKGSDKTELNQAITNLSNFVGALPEGATSTTVVAYIQEVVDGLKIGDYAKASDLLALADRVKAVEDKVKVLEETTIPAIETEIDGLDTRVQALEEIDHEHENADVLAAITSDKVTAWDDAVAKKHEHTNKSILDAITQDKVNEWDSVTSKASNADLELLKSRVSETETAIDGIPDAISGKVDKKTTVYNDKDVEWILLSPENQDKLSKLVLNEDGSVTTGQTVAAGDVQGLAEWITSNAKTLDLELTKSNLSDELVTQIESAIKEITVNGKVLEKVDGKVDIPLATKTAHGTVMLGDEFKVADSGAMEINSINVNKLTQTAGETLELNGGNASGSFE